VLSDFIRQSASCENQTVFLLSRLCRVAELNLLFWTTHIRINPVVLLLQLEGAFLPVIFETNHVSLLYLPTFAESKRTRENVATVFNYKDISTRVYFLHDYHFSSFPIDLQRMEQAKKNS